MAKYLAVAGLAALLTVGVVFVALRNSGRTDVTVTVEEIKKITELSTVEYVMSDVVRRYWRQTWLESERTQLWALVNVKGE